MADKVIDLTQRLSAALKAEDEDDVGHETFLLEEGLAVLAAYRAIADRDVRLSVMSLLQNLARAEKAPRKEGSPD